MQLPLAPVAEDAAAIAEVTASGWLWALPATVSLSASFALAIGLFWFAYGRALKPASRRRWTVVVHRLGRPVTAAIPALACRPPPIPS